MTLTLRPLTLKPLTDDNCCAACGSDDIRLAEDQTRYSVLKWDTFGTPQAVYSDTQEQYGCDSVAAPKIRRSSASSCLKD